MTYRAIDALTYAGWYLLLVVVVFPTAAARITWLALDQLWDWCVDRRKMK